VGAASRSVSGGSRCRFITCHIPNRQAWANNVMFLPFYGQALQIMTGLERHDASGFTQFCEMLPDNYPQRPTTKTRESAHIATMSYERLSPVPPSSTLRGSIDTAGPVADERTTAHPCGALVDPLLTHIAQSLFLNRGRRTDNFAAAACCLYSIACYTYFSSSEEGQLLRHNQHGLFQDSSPPGVGEHPRRSPDLATSFADTMIIRVLPSKPPSTCYYGFQHMTTQDGTTLSRSRSLPQRYTQIPSQRLSQMLALI
jgi:hypothetical protein